MKIDYNTVCIVTGGAVGLGLATVKAFLEYNCKIVVADIHPDSQAILEKISKNIFYVKTDVSEENSIKELIEKTVNKFGAIHVVVNCAGPFVNEQYYSKTSDYQKSFNINVIGTFNVCKYAAGQMMKQPDINEFKEKGVLINVTSIAGYEGKSATVIYSGTRGAIISMALPMARDLGKFGIRVCTIAPGVFTTGMSEMLPKKILDAHTKQSAINRLGDPKEFGDIVINLCKNTYVTGNVIRIDGGLRLSNL